MNTVELANEIRGIVQTTIESSGIEMAVEDDLSLIDGGLLDSMSIVVLVQNLQQTFDISIDFSDITVSNFDSVTALVEYVTDRKADN